ncbi:inovirus Gp2 family protein [Acinetobacter baumannii]|nr:inovirus Gp2 family protein [Acinetobacter baumannii]
MQTEAQTLLRIEKLLIQVGELSQDQWRHTARLKQIVRECCQLIQEFKKIYDSELHYAPFINAFRFNVVGFVDALCQTKGCSLADIEHCDEWFGVMTRLLNAYQFMIKEEQYAFTRQEKRNACSLGKYVKSLIEHYSRLTFVRVDLKYCKNSPQEITINDVYRHLAILCNRLSNADGCFKYLQGHAWAIEQGEKDGGYHIHLLLIYDYSELDNDKRQGKLVGEEWLKITEGCGAYFNINDSEVRDDYIAKGIDGLGLVSRDAPQKVKNAINAALYLTRPSKFQQRLRVKVSSAAHSFDKGDYERSFRRQLNPHVEFNLYDYEWLGC